MSDASPFSHSPLDPTATSPANDSQSSPHPNHALIINFLTNHTSKTPLPTIPFLPPNEQCCPICQEDYISAPSHAPRGNCQAPVRVDITDSQIQQSCRHVFGIICPRSHLYSQLEGNNRCPVCRVQWFEAEREEQRAEIRFEIPAEVMLRLLADAMGRNQNEDGSEVRENSSDIDDDNMTDVLPASNPSSDFSYTPRIAARFHNVLSNNGRLHRSIVMLERILQRFALDDADEETVDLVGNIETDIERSWERLNDMQWTQ